MQIVTAHGAEIPALGFGVFRMPTAEVERIVPVALEVGFTHFDTAQIDKNEAALGHALQSAGARRETLFLTTKTAKPGRVALGDADMAAIARLARPDGRLVSPPGLALAWPA